MKQKKSPSIKINKIRIVGTRKNYDVEFTRGINIIYGDSDTGKSSILNLIDYCFGAKNINLYKELEEGGKYCLLEVWLNDILYTIKRSLFKPRNLIEVYQSELEKISEIFPYRYDPIYAEHLKNNAHGFFGDFMLEALNIPNIKIKTAPSKEESKIVRLGFRQIFKYCYMNQDDVGSKKILDSNNWSVYAKNKETFKFINNLLDTQITELQNNISNKVKERARLDGQYEVISNFFKDIDMSPKELLEKNLVEIEENILTINSEIENMSVELLGDTEYLNELRSLINTFENEILKKEKEHLRLENQLQQNLRLKTKYDEDILKIESGLVIKKGINPIEVNCPVCRKAMSPKDILEDFIVSTEKELNFEKKNLQRRRKSLVEIIDECREDIFNLESEKNTIIKDLNKAENLLDKRGGNLIFPYISQNDGLVYEKGILMSKKESMLEKLKIRKQYDLVLVAIKNIDMQLEVLREDVEIFSENMPSFTEKNIRLSGFIKEFLSFVGVKNIDSIEINEKDFLPLVRGVKYSELTSGGLRTLVSVGYYLAILLESLEVKMQIPSFLMIDTIGKYLGKIDNENEKIDSNGVIDPEKYKNIYKYLISKCNKISETNEFQIIIVDNDIPKELLSNLESSIIKKFSSKVREGYSIGLIDDANM